MEEVGGDNGVMAISARAVPGRPMAATSIEECGGYSESLQLFSVRLADRSITTTLTCLASEVERWITDTIRIHRRRLNRLVVGLDVEWRPSFNPRVEHPAALLQLCVGHRCLVNFSTLTPYPRPCSTSLGAPSSASSGWASSLIWRNSWRGTTMASTVGGPPELGRRQAVIQGVDVGGAQKAGGGQTQEGEGEGEDEQVGSAMARL